MHGYDKKKNILTFKFTAPSPKFSKKVENGVSSQFQRKGIIHNGDRETEGDRRREETGETVPYLCKQQHARPWQHTHINVRAKTGMLNPPGICWHDGTPYAHVQHAQTHTHTHTHSSCLHAGKPQHLHSDQHFYFLLLCFITHETGFFSSLMCFKGLSCFLSLLHISLHRMQRKHIDQLLQDV